jgi:hypothetical protein
MKKLLALAAVATLLAACGGEDASLPPLQNPRAALLDAMTAVYEAGTMHEEFEMTISAQGEELSFRGEADVDTERQRASMSMDLGMVGGSMDMIMDRGVIYLRSDVMPLADTEWVSFDAAKIDPAAASQFGGFGGSMDPSAYAALFAGAVHVAERGTEEIDGVETTHYVGTIDLAKAIEGFSETFRKDVDRKTAKQLEAAFGQLEDLGMGSIPFEAWIDAAGLLRRERLSMDFGGLIPGAEDAAMEMTVDFSDFGKPIDIELPKPSQVTDVTRELARAGGSGAYG